MLATERCLLTKQRRTFTPEFKREAACLVLDQGYSHTKAARSFRLVESVLHRWVSQLQQGRGGVTPTSKALTPEQQKIQELEARIYQLERDKSILKMATALSMAEEYERSRYSINCGLKSLLIYCARYLKSPDLATTRTAENVGIRMPDESFCVAA